MIPTLRISLLGDFLLVVDDKPVTALAVPRLQSLLAYLLLHRDAPQDRSHLAFLLWPDSTEAQAHTNLRKLLYQLRQALSDIEHFLRTDKQSLHWLSTNADVRWTLDVQEVERALEQAQQAEQAQDTRTQRQGLEQALRLYRGDLLPNCYDEWILPERDRLRQVFIQAAERLIALTEQERDYTAAIATAQRLLRADPLHEATYRHLMRLHAQDGDRVAAIRVYHTCATTLERELGVEPSKATRQMHETLLQMDAAPSPQTVTPASRGTRAPLVGRAREWASLQAAWQRSQRGHPQVVVLSGEAGIGKTRLAEEMEAWVSRQGMQTAVARCYAAEGRLAYAPVITWLRADSMQINVTHLDDLWLSEIARLDPDLLRKRSHLPPSAPITEGWQRQHLFEALAHALLDTRRPLLLLLDDLQWCDNETLEWVHYLLHFASEAPVLLVGTARSEEISPENPLVTFLSTLQRDGLVTEIALGPLSTAETTALAEQVARKQLDPTTVQSLYHETEGNPLFVVEMVRARATTEREKPSANNGNQSARSLFPLLTRPASTLPPTVQTILSARLAQLSPAARQMANVAAVIGREFAFPVLVRASGESEDTVVQGLDELWQRRIVREQGAGTADTYDFSHDKLREQAYSSLSPAHRRLLHRRVAEAFAMVYARDLDGVSGQIAAHYERAGLAEQAIPYYGRAGKVALRIFANTEAVTAFQSAVTLLETHAHQELAWEEAAALYLALGDVLGVMGQQEDARQIYQRGLATVPAQEYIWQARLLRKTASTWNFASSNPLDTFHSQARQIFQEAERVLEQREDRSGPAWISEWIDLQIAQLLPLRGSVEEMTACIDKAKPMVERYGTGEQRGQLLQAIGSRDSKRDRYVASDETILEHRNSLAAVQRTGNKVLIGFSHFSLANHLSWAGQLGEAEQEMQAAIALAEQTGNTRLLARCLTFLPCVFRQRGQVEQVRSVVARALTVPEARYTALIKGHQAWIAWREGKLTEAEAFGRASVEEGEHQQMGVNPFQWVGLWPLIGGALAQEQPADAIRYARMLLAPTQQPPPGEIAAPVVAALAAWDGERQEEARALLQQLVPLAKEMGYL
ncbi:MAG TPA: BTAD domain-containing putative transcriptional regulator [Ktedonobacteraceae bacterium]|nr:BTAD domain-containing putative transcriptional regulator [Ktedonobacteraceae bacterium]